MHASKLEFAQGTQSDHLATLYAYRAYFGIPVGLGDPRTKFAIQRHLCPKTLDSMRIVKRQLLEQVFAPSLPRGCCIPAPVLVKPIKSRQPNEAAYL